MDREEKEKLVLIPQAAVQAPSLPPPPARPRQTEEFLPQREQTDLGEADFEVAVRLSTDGRVMTSKGSADDLADVAAYVARLGQLTAEALGMEQFMAIECASDQETCIIYRAVGGDLVAVKSSQPAAFFGLKDQLNL
ncbi:MAG: hypothetical protein MJE77_22810 [Proteobacteria bacterium]|nr:hypothetical protein [Pseudomonadota bacterium]